MKHILQKSFFTREKVVLMTIIGLALLLRVWQLGIVPPSPDWDEAALGYNAYSLLETGKDEYGVTFPIVLESFQDYKPALYTYLIIPLLPLFGLDLIAIRLPSAILGVIVVYITYKIVAELLRRSRLKEISKNYTIYTWLPLLSALLLAISPWHIQFSRVAFETNLGLTLNLLCIYFFLKSLGKPFFLFYAATFAALSLYAYQSEKIFVPLLLLSLVIIYGKEILRFPKKILISSFLLGFLLVLPMLHFIFTNDEALARAQSTSIFANNQKLLEPSLARLVVATENNDVLGMIVNNRRVAYTGQMVVNYVSHFNPVWLFITGDIERHHAPQMGLLYWFELPFLLLGFFTLFFSRKLPLGRKEKAVIILWILIAPLPASFTNDVPHAVRTLNFLPTFQIVTAVGILSVVLFMSRFKKYKRVFFTVGLILMLCNFLYFLNQYFVEQNKQYSKDWQYGYKEAVMKVETMDKKYEKIVIANQSPMDQSHIFFLYYLEYPPALYQKEQDEKKSFANFEFRPILWNEERKDGTTLFIGRPKDFPDAIVPLYRIDYLNNEPAIYFVDSQN